MARYDNFPVFKKAMQLQVYLENTVRGFSRYHKYTIGTRLRETGWELLNLIIKANSIPSHLRRAVLQLWKEFPSLGTLLHGPLDKQGNFKLTRKWKALRTPKSFRQQVGFFRRQYPLMKLRVQYGRGYRCFDALSAYYPRGELTIQQTDFTEGHLRERIPACLVFNEGGLV